MPTIPDAVPSRFAAGTTVKFHRSFDDFLASDGWAYTFYANGASATFNQVGTVNSDGKSFDVVIVPATTAAKPAGRYQCGEVLVNSGSGEKVYPSGTHLQLELEPNIETAAAGAFVSTFERTLAIIDAAIEGRLAGDLQSYIVAGRQVQKIPIRELTQLQGLYRSKVYRLKNPGTFTEAIEVAFPGDSDPDDVPETWADSNLS